MHYTTLLSLALAATIESHAIEKRQPLSHLRGKTGEIFDKLTRNRLGDRLPKVGPVFDRIKVPGRPKWRGEGNSDGSPEYPYLFANPLPIPETAVPQFTEIVNGVPIDYYEMTIESFDSALFPDRGPTSLIG